ncbi:MAG: type II toxin-antitoxin system RelB/DinJ family antitoxin [Rickettsiaceae bacterium]|nr:type II toxin-antitoxin system RelB/DinJ family antitoxin [Rickettsiaceae bacterium]
MTTIDVRLRITSEIKNDAEAVFKDMGMTLNEAIRIFLKQSINSGGLPFRPHAKMPNEETLKAFQQDENGEYTKSSLAEFKKYLNTINNERN